MLLGHAGEPADGTGVSVLRFDHNVVRRERVSAGIDLRGSSTSTRQCDSLAPSHHVDGVHGFCFAGGSAYGLVAGDGVMRALAELGLGTTIGDVRVPSAPTAILFDLWFNQAHRGGRGSRFPDAEMGRAATLAATANPSAQGSIGAGIGASVGKLGGFERCMKGGIGTASCKAGALVVGAFVAVNAFGDVLDEEGKVLAGLRKGGETLELENMSAYLQAAASERFGSEGGNTTLCLVATNAKLNKVEATLLARQAQVGLSRCIAPVHSLFDGDLCMACSTGELDANLLVLGEMAIQAVQTAVRRGVREADGLGTLPAWRDLPR